MKDLKRRSFAMIKNLDTSDDYCALLGISMSCLSIVGLIFAVSRIRSTLSTL